QVLVDDRAIERAAIGDLRGGGGRGSRGGRGLGGGARAAGIDRTGRRDAVLGAPGRRRISSRRQGAVEGNRSDDQPQRDQGQEAGHRRDALEKLKVVVAHVETPLAGGRRAAAGFQV